MKRSIVIPFLFVSFLGFLDAGYLTASHYLRMPPPCIITHGCETVTSSVYSQIGGIPVALLGALYYLTIFLLTIVFFDTKKRVFFDIARAFTIGGLLFSLWFLFVQAFLLHAYCIYCLGSLTTSTLLFLIAIFSYVQEKKIPLERLEKTT